MKVYSFNPDMLGKPVSGTYLDRPELIAGIAVHSHMDGESLLIRPFDQATPFYSKSIVVQGGYVPESVYCLIKTLGYSTSDNYCWITGENGYLLWSQPPKIKDYPSYWNF